MYTFEAGKTYRQQFSNGDAVQFTAVKQFKNGNWHGVAVEVSANNKKGKPRQVTVFSPPLPTWQEITNN